MQEIITKIVQDKKYHAKWLNALSFMENAGARKISKSEDPLKVSLIQLKHAAEEHRHAYYLKKQIAKLDAGILPYYFNDELLAAKQTRYYLHALDIKCCKYLKEQLGLEGSDLKYAAYLFVTYVIEVRADDLYPVYQDVLTALDQKVMVKSIIVEEEGHLEEMIDQLEVFDPNWKNHAEKIQEIENNLFKNWMNAIANEIES